MEIDDPNLNYRQGNGIIEDLRKTGTVRVLPPKNGQSKHAILRKTFEQPMFEQGKLWYGLKAVGDKPEVLVTRESL